MNDNALTEFIIEIKASLARLEAKLDSVQTTLANHETRLMKIENDGKISLKTAGDCNFKDDVVKLLVKAALISICGFATLAGAGGVIAKIIGL